MADKAFKSLTSELMSNNMWMKLVDMTVGRSLTAYLREAKMQLKLGVRFDFDKTITHEDGTEYNMFKLQANARKIPSTIQAWRDKNGGTHAVIATVLIKKNGTTDDVKAAIEAAKQKFKDTL